MVSTSIANWVYKPAYNSADLALYGSSTVEHKLLHLYMSMSELSSYMMVCGFHSLDSSSKWQNHDKISNVRGVPFPDMS